MWISSDEGYGHGHDPSWLNLGSSSGDGGLIVLLVTTGLAFWWSRSGNAVVGRETVELRGRHAYIVFPDGIGRSKLTNTVIESRLGTRGTGRNWNTVLKLAELAAS